MCFEFEFPQSHNLVVVNGGCIFRLQMTISTVGCTLTEMRANCSFGVWEVSARNSISTFFPEHEERMKLHSNLINALTLMFLSDTSESFMTSMLKFRRGKKGMGGAWKALAAPSPSASPLQCPVAHCRLHGAS